MSKKLLQDKLAPHFSWNEFFRSKTASRNGIDNIPNDYNIPNITSADNVIYSIKHLANHVLEPIRKHFGDRPINISSGFRCLKLNKMLGSSNKSHHVFGKAVDFEISRVDNNEVFNEIVKHKFVRYDQIILEYYDDRENLSNDGWIHLGISEPDSNSTFRFGYIGSYPRLDEDLSKGKLYPLIIEKIKERDKKISNLFKEEKERLENIHKENKKINNRARMLPDAIILRNLYKDKRVTYYFIGDLINEDDFDEYRSSIDKRDKDIRMEIRLCETLEKHGFFVNYKGMKIVGKQG